MGIINSKDVWNVQGDTDWKRVRAMTDEEIEAAIADDPDTIDTDEAFWEDAVLCPPLVDGFEERKAHETD